MVETKSFHILNMNVKGHKKFHNPFNGRISSFKGSDTQRGIPGEHLQILKVGEHVHKVLGSDISLRRQTRYLVKKIVLL